MKCYIYNKILLQVTVVPTGEYPINLIQNPLITCRITRTRDNIYLFNDNGHYNALLWVERRERLGIFGEVCFCKQIYFIDSSSI
jgi:hypothetical protein